MKKINNLVFSSVKNMNKQIIYNLNLNQIKYNNNLIFTTKKFFISNYFNKLNDLFNNIFINKYRINKNKHINTKMEKKITSNYQGTLPENTFYNTLDILTSEDITKAKEFIELNLRK